MRASLKTFAFLFLVVGLTPGGMLYRAAPLAAQSTGPVASTTDTPRQKVEQWLARARQAMQEGRYTLAEYCIQSAENAAKAVPAGEALSYSPADARAELASLRGQAPAEAPAAAPATSATASTDGVQPMSMLLRARQALAGGDVETATVMVERARQSGLDFSQTMDSPARVQQLIERQNELVQMAQGGDPKQFNYQASLFLMRQANELMTHQDWKTAASVIEQARQFPAHYGPQDPTPDQLTAKLNQLRGQAGVTSESWMPAKAEAVKLMSQAQLAFDRGDLDQAKALTLRAKALNVPEHVFAGNDIRPWEFELKVNEAINLRGNIAQASYAESRPAETVVQADYHPEQDKTKNVQVSHASTDGELSRGMQMYSNGMEAMKKGDSIAAKQYFQLASAYRDQLDAATQQSLQENLTQLAGTSIQEPAANTAADQEKQLFRQMQTDVFRERATAEQMLNNKDARGAMRHLSQLREQIAQSKLSDTAKRPLMVIVDRDIEEMSSYIETHIAEIENDEMNAQRNNQLVEQRQRRSDIEVKVAQLIAEFESLVDEQRFPEAEVVARQATSLAPNMPEVVVLQEKAKLVRRMAELESINNAKEDGFVHAMAKVERDSIPFAKLIEYDAQNWEELTGRRKDSLMKREASRSEMRILKALRETTFQGSFNAEPLSQVIDRLAQLSGVNIVFDRSAIEANKANTELPITKNFGAPISLESVLKLVVADAGLVFVAEDEVVKIASPEYRRANLVQHTYYVGDLVYPIPTMMPPMYMNFLSPNTVNPLGATGLQPNATSSGTPLTLSSQPSTQPVSELALAQQLPGSPLSGLPLWNRSGGAPQTGTPVFSTVAPPSVGGITQADFQQLIQLIQQTIEPPSWDDDNASIRAYVNTLSLIVTNTQEVQDQIEDLLIQLRELNDVQIVIEVRFITLRDSFFERIGVDFDFQIEDNTSLQPGQTLPDRVNGTTVVGRQGVDTFLPTTNLDVAFGQNSFTSAIPTFGGFDTATAANFGFAILSDIEVFFLIQASKGDTRTNVLQAPTVTLTNGQTATVFDGTQRPFVTSVIPVVGDFAAAQQPIITILPEGSSLNVRAAASNDRRFVTMTLVPVFSQITKVDTFTFEGRRVVDQFGSTDNTSGGNGNGNGSGSGSGDNGSTEDIIVQGTTVQLPSLTTTTVLTTVNVPDGGTILMGGIKRLSEGRNERGIPFLSNLPYVNRLFKNVGIGRETSSLMMMVTPRIIIQQEEERRQVGNVGG